MRILVVSLSTYSAPFNDGKLAKLGLRGIDVTAVAGDVPTLWGGEGASRSGDGYRVQVLKTRFHRRNATTLLRNLGRVSSVAEPDLIHIECEPWQGVAVQSVLLAGKLRLPVGIQFAENGPVLRGAAGALRRFFARRVLGRCRYAIGWSSGSTAVARDLAPSILLETYPGTGVSESDQAADSFDDPDRWFGPGSAEHPRLAFVGRFAPEKGLEDFLGLAELLAERLPVRVAIAGGESSHPLLNGWLRSHPWARAHGVLGRPQVTELLAAADVLVCPSRTTSFAKEQFGKTAVEAMAVGTPVFAFDCGALREVIGNGGVVVAEGASVALRDELERYFRSSAAARRQLADQARTRATQFTDAALAEGLIRLWSGVLESDPISRRSATAAP